MHWQRISKRGSFCCAAMTAFLLITIGHVTFSCHASNVGLGAPVTGGEVGELY